MTQLSGARSKTEIAIEEAGGFIHHGEQHLLEQSLFCVRKGNRIGRGAPLFLDWTDLGSNHVYGNLHASVYQTRRFYGFKIHTYGKKSIMRQMATGLSSYVSR